MELVSCRAFLSTFIQQHNEMQKQKRKTPANNALLQELLFLGYKVNSLEREYDRG